MGDGSSVTSSLEESRANILSAARSSFVPKKGRSLRCFEERRDGELGACMVFLSSMKGRFLLFGRISSSSSVTPLSSSSRSAGCGEKPLSNSMSSDESGVFSPVCSGRTRLNVGVSGVGGSRPILFLSARKRESIDLGVPSSLFKEMEPEELGSIAYSRGGRGQVNISS